jgi:hypothetical protein
MITTMALRAAWAAPVAMSLAFVPAARAQQGMQFPTRSQGYTDLLSPPIAPADMANYCVYENRVFSIGSGLCLGRTPYVCIPSQGPATGNRAYWTSKEDQVFVRPACM